MKRNKTKISIIGTAGLPANYGGFETLTNHLVEHLSDTYDISVYCSSIGTTAKKRPTRYKGAKLHYLPFKANGIQSIPYDTVSIIHSLFYTDVLLILGVAGAWILPFIKLFTNKKIIISIDGIEWTRNKWPLLAKLYLWWAESMAVRYSHIDISDNEAIQDYTAQRYGSLSTVIEYGGNQTMHVAPTEEDYKQYPLLGVNYGFTVCRIEPENNIDMILSAFSKNTNLPLIIVGNWGNSPYGIALREKYSVHAHIHLLDPIYDQRSLDLYRSNAYIYVHGHMAGGTNPSLVEAMSLGLPVFSFKASYNVATTENKAFYFNNEFELRSLLSRTKFQHLRETGHHLLEVANRRYKWSIISSRYEHMINLALTTQSKEKVKPRFPNWSASDMKEYGLAHLSHPHLFYNH